MTRPKDVNAPSPWNTRIWDEDNNEWLGQSNPDGIPYYGFDIRGGEVTMFQSMDRVYKQVWGGRRLIWERSTGLVDKNGVEIYGGDIVKIKWNFYEIVFDEYNARFALKYVAKPDEIDFKGVPAAMMSYLEDNNGEVIGNIHENPELLGSDTDALTTEGEK